MCVCVRMSVSEFMYTGVKLTTLTEIMENTQHTQAKCKAKCEIIRHTTAILPSFVELRV